MNFILSDGKDTCKFSILQIPGLSFPFFYAAVALTRAGDWKKVRIFGLCNQRSLPAVKRTPEKKLTYCLCILLCVAGFARMQAAESPAWREKNADVRAVLSVQKAGGAVACDVLWRLPWAEERLQGGTFALFRASDGRRITNLYVRECSADRAILAFEAPEAGTYELYYTPSGTAEDQPLPSPDWKKKYRPDNYPDFMRLPAAKTLEITLANGIKDNPYDRAATRTEAGQYLAKARNAFQARIVPAAWPLNGDDRIPLGWVDGALSPAQADTVRVAPGGKALIQAGIVGTGQDGCRVSVRHTSAPSAGILLRTAGPEDFALTPGAMRSAWIVAEARPDAVPGFYDLTLRAEGNGQAQDMPFVLQVTDGKDGAGENFAAEFIARLGQSEAGERENRKQDEYGVNPRFPVAVYGDYEVRSAGNVLSINPATALPLQIRSGGEDLLSDPVLLVFATSNGIRKIGVKDLDFIRKDGGVQVWRGHVRTHDMVVELEASLSAYGLVRYEIDVEALSDIDFRNISLEAGFSPAVTRACYGTTCIAEHSTTVLRPKDPWTGLWLGGGRGGVFVTVEADESNVFYSGADASVTLYKGTQTGLIVGSGALKVPAGRKISLRCAMQILPADYAAADAAQKNILLVPADELADLPAGMGADHLAIKHPVGLLEAEADRAAGELFATGVNIVPFLDPYELPANGVLARTLASMGYAYGFSDDGKTMRFAPDDDLAPALDYLCDRILEKEYISGVLLADADRNRKNLHRYSLLRTGAGKPFGVFFYERGFDASLLGDTPWLDAVVTADTLGAPEKDCQASLGGLKAFYKAGRTGLPQALAYGANVYAEAGDSISVRRAREIWAARKALGIDDPSAVFFPEGDIRMPVEPGNPFVRAAAYELADRLVMIYRNTSPMPQHFTPQFDFGALGIERWEVDRLDIVPVGEKAGSAEGRMLLLGDEVALKGGESLVLVLRWVKRSGQKN